MRTYIRVSDSLRRELVDRFEESRTSIWSAINYLTNGDRPEAIRQYALSHGGSIEEQNFIPNCRTEHTQDEIIQTFAGGVQVRVNRKDGAVALMNGDKLGGSGVETAPLRSSIQSAPRPDAPHSGSSATLIPSLQGADSTILCPTAPQGP